MQKLKDFQKQVLEVESDFRKTPNHNRVHNSWEQ